MKTNILVIFFFIALKISANSKTLHYYYKKNKVCKVDVLDNRILTESYCYVYGKLEKIFKGKSSLVPISSITDRSSFYGLIIPDTIFHQNYKFNEIDTTYVGIYSDHFTIDFINEQKMTNNTFHFLANVEKSKKVKNQYYWNDFYYEMPKDSFYTMQTVYKYTNNVVASSYSLKRNPILEKKPNEDSGILNIGRYIYFKNSNLVSSIEYYHQKFSTNVFDLGTSDIDLITENLDTYSKKRIIDYYIMYYYNKHKKLVKKEILPVNDSSIIKATYEYFYDKKGKLIKEEVSE